MERTGMIGRLAAVAVGVMVSPIAGCERPGPSPDRAAPVIPDVVEVVCSATGASVSGTVVAARTDGVHVRIRNTSQASGAHIDRYHATDRGWQLSRGSSIAAGVNQRSHLTTAAITGLVAGVTRAVADRLLQFFTITW